jgi:hypothetical protein
MKSDTLQREGIVLKGEFLHALQSKDGQSWWSAPSHRPKDSMVIEPAVNQAVGRGARVIEKRPLNIKG